MSLLCLNSPAEAREWCAGERRAGRSLGFVATMGAMHRAHVALVEQAARENDSVVVSVFVNPLQFNDPRDLENYPRDWEGDCQQVEQAGGSLLFTGTLATFFPAEFDAEGGLKPGYLLDPGVGAMGLEGEFRPGHFAGVATIVDRLFQTTMPSRAYFGLKDYQQCLVVQDLARARGNPEVVLCPIVREQDGLALSSRNQRLTPAWREAAPAISQALLALREQWRAGERRVNKLESTLAASLSVSPLEVEYAAVRDPEQWSAGPLKGSLEQAVALVAARAGDVRLIDNLLLDSAGGGSS